MTFKIPGSEIQRAYAKKAKEKGWVKEEVITKQASNKNYTYKPSNDIVLDVCVLSQALRSKGYENYANDLENKVMAFKTAQNSLYHIKTDDLMEFAHPDGDVYIEDANDDLGYIETLIGQHNKIVDIVNKEPKIKNAQLNLESDDFEDETSNEPKWEDDFYSDEDKVNLDDEDKMKAALGYLAKLARDPNTATDTLKYIAFLPHREVEEMVDEDKIELLKNVNKEYSMDEIKSFVVANANVSNDVISMLAHNTGIYPITALVIAKNPNTSKDVLKSILENRETPEEIRSYVRDRLETPEVLKEAQLKDSIAQYLSRFKFELTLPKVFDLFKTNSGSLYDFVNVYYHDFFTKAYEYVNDALSVYGSYGMPIAQSIMAGLDKDPVQYLSNIQKNTGIKTIDLIPPPGTDIDGWFSNKKEQIAEEVHKRFGNRYNSIISDLKNVNININDSFNKVVNSFMSAQKDPAKMKQYLSEIASNGSYKYIYDAINAFFGENYANVFNMAFDQVSDEVESATGKVMDFKDRVQATMGRLNSAGLMLIDAFSSKAGLREKHEGTIKAMHDMIQVLERNINSTPEKLLSDLPDGLTYNSFDELDKDTMDLLEFIKKEVS